MNSPVKKNPLRRGALAALTAALVLGSTLAAQPAHAAAGEGDLTVTVVDPAGAKLAASYLLLPEGAETLGDGVYSEELGTSFTETVPAGRYGIVAIAPWGGILCAGVSPCTSGFVFSGSGVPVTVTGAVDVPEEGSATYQFTAPAPAVVVGGPKLGGTLAVEFSEPMDRLLNSIGGVYGAVTPQWLRDGKVIPGAKSEAYTLGVQDVGHTIAPRLNWSGILTNELFSPAFAEHSRTLPPTTIAKVRTTTRATAFRRVLRAGRHKSSLIGVVGREAVPAGKVSVQVGKWTKTKRLWNGSTRVLLPKLKRGRYVVKVSYAGTAVFAPSKTRFVVRVR